MSLYTNLLDLFDLGIIIVVQSTQENLWNRIQFIVKAGCLLLHVNKNYANCYYNELLSYIFKIITGEDIDSTHKMV